MLVRPAYYFESATGTVIPLSSQMFLIALHRFRSAIVETLDCVQSGESS